MKTLLTCLLLFSTGCAGWRRAMNSHCAEAVWQYRDMQRNPDRYMNTLHAFRGDVTEARKVKETLILRMSIKGSFPNHPASPEDSILVVCPSSFALPIRAGDKDVSVLGRIAGSLSGDQSFGAQVDAITLRMAAIKSAKGEWFEPNEEQAYSFWRDCK
ncbi:MAG: hypothetical protein WC728_13285 [Elusimicrobiota bacterium]